MANTAVITGAASGIGLAAAQDLLKRGWTVYGIDVGDALAGAAAKALVSENFHALACDLRDGDAVRATVAAIAARVDAVNALICSAGVIKLGRLADMSLEDFDTVFDVNVRGLWLTTREVLPLLRRAAGNGALARVVMLSSVSAIRPKVESGAYAASKAAVSQLTQVLAVECAGDGILVNAIAPGTVDTPMIRGQSDPTKRGGWRPSGPSPLGRVAEPIDIVRVIRFLLSDEAAYVAGAVIPVDGGTRAAFVPPITS